jgi:putrescine transport system substrate-binding protein
LTKRIVAWLFGMAVLVTGIAAASAEAPKVAIYNWNDYIGTDTLDSFTKATGLETTYDVYDSLETLEQKLLVEHSGYDVVVPTAEPTLSRLIKAQALQKLDKSRIPNLKGLDPALMRLVAGADPGNDYGVIYQWGTIGLGINPNRIKALFPDAPLESWDLLFKPENAARLAACGITILDSGIDVIPTVLHYLGLDPDSERPEDLERVEALLMALRPSIKAFVTDQTIDMLGHGEACLAFSYSGDALQARERALTAGGTESVTYVIPKEGAEVWFDTMAIPADAPNPAGAHAFINYVLQPEVMAGISNTVHYANAVPRALPLLDPSVRTDPAVYPPPEISAKFFTVTAISAAGEAARARLWARIRTEP